ncbi:MAG TPA: type II secretion system protein [Candidatus Paceibacterota bacterium]|nr:type II secretion system protein [Candidatus Paceibacterota bacterium]
MKINRKKKGFTLIELLVVIAIIAILAVVVVLTLNPAELLRQARDSNRISDFATLKSALSLYATDVSTSTPMYGAQSGASALNLYASYPTASSSAFFNTTGTWGFLGGETTVTSTNTRAVDGSGWIPVNLNAISSGAPISSYPVDPSNTGGNLYVYAASSTVFKLATKMESQKYGGATSVSNVTQGDGGNSSSTYEAGTNLTQL